MVNQSIIAYSKNRKNGTKWHKSPNFFYAHHPYQKTKKCALRNCILLVGFEQTLADTRVRKIKKKLKNAIFLLHVHEIFSQ